MACSCFRNQPASEKRKHKCPMQEVQSMPTEWQEGQYNRDASVFPRSTWVTVRAWTGGNGCK